ncbi:DUF3727 domain-containing protein [Oscillatoria sp. FACHB-1406]|uniref:DUF3727 domain-containing protein n=1 Tax=Oscillatoria sp. FACHB-1406 TaxID=2692846 RepID=UPI0016882EA7|nr:DUF3727 domain-containing protein [Oscillatoria sp. FACHB-1406]MBD2580251.1 DUF3727 domain-containing protein [Oscillatoria sp. FACHB-1406]
MTQYSSSESNGQSSPESVTLTDEMGRSLSCYVERSFSIEGSTYHLLLPVDAPIAIIAWDSEEETANATWIENSEELEELFPDAKAVLAEQELVLQDAAYTLTVAGELPEVDEDDLLTLEVENDGGDIETDEYQFLATFFHNEQEYEIYTPLSPLLFFARELSSGKLELLSPEDFKKVQPFIEDLLFE